MTAEQLRAVLTRLIAAGHWRDGDPPILIVTDAGYDITRLAYLLADLPVDLVGRIRSDRVLRLPTPPRLPGNLGRPPNVLSANTPVRATPRPPRPLARHPDRLQDVLELRAVPGPARRDDQ